MLLNNMLLNNLEFVSSTSMWFKSQWIHFRSYLFNCDCLGRIVDRNCAVMWNLPKKCLLTFDEFKCNEIIDGWCIGISFISTDLSICHFKRLRLQSFWCGTTPSTPPIWVVCWRNPPPTTNQGQLTYPTIITYKNFLTLKNSINTLSDSIP